MAKENISVKFLIHLIGERPALWDKTSEEYKDRSLKETSWREICTFVNENYERMTPKAKEEFSKLNGFFRLFFLSLSLSLSLFLFCFSILFTRNVYFIFDVSFK